MSWMWTGAVYTEVQRNINTTGRGRGRGRGEGGGGVRVASRGSGPPSRAPPAPPSQAPTEVYGNANEMSTPRYVSVDGIIVAILFIKCETSLLYRPNDLSVYRVRHKKQPPKKTYISRERHNLNYSNLQRLLPRDTTWDFENFIHIFGRKQKLQLSKLKSAILQLNTRYYRYCYIENANKTNCMEFVWKDECLPNLLDLNPLDYYIWAAMLKMYSTNVTHQSRLTLMELKKRSWLTCPKAQINAAINNCRSAKGFRCAKSRRSIFRTYCLNWSY